MVIMEEPVAGRESHGSKGEQSVYGSLRVVPPIGSPPITPSIMTPKSPFVSRFVTPIASPMRKAMASMQEYMEEVGHFTKLDPQEAWLPITESRNGNSWYAAFHALSSGIGFQALVLPLAFMSLGWIWGVVCLSLGFIWQLYTLWLLIQLHESETGMRYSRYLRLAITAFGEKLGKLLVLFPTMYLSGGTCVTLIMIGGGTMKIFYELICSHVCHKLQITTVEWYLIFTCSAIVLAQLPNLNSIAGVSLVGGATAVGYCTLIWVLSVTRVRPDAIAYERLNAEFSVDGFFGVLNGLGIIAFCFRGHNLVLEIQGTMPSSAKHPSRVPMWRGMKAAYLIILVCLFPTAIGGYWAFGNLIPANGGLLSALYIYHKQDTSKALLGVSSLLVVINSLTSYQIYAMPVFDNLELRYTSNMNKPCPRWLRSGFRVFFGFLTFFIAVALPMLKSLAGLIGGIALPVTLAYPCFMWIILRKPRKYSSSWMLNWGLGCAGMVLSILLITASVWSIVTKGLEGHFFKPK
ncbi:unnamed protein product [Rhodiola kirilowii]